MRTAMRTPVILAVCALALSGCQDNAAEPSGDGDAQTAEGEVLGGSISDAMLPLDTITSQPPALRETPAASSGNSPSEEDAPSDDAAPEATAETDAEAGSDPAEETEPEG